MNFFNLSIATAVAIATRCCTAAAASRRALPTFCFTFSSVIESALCAATTASLARSIVASAAFFFPLIAVSNFWRATSVFIFW